MKKNRRSIFQLSIALQAILFLMSYKLCSITITVINGSQHPITLGEYCNTQSGTTQALLAKIGVPTGSAFQEPQVVDTILSQQTKIFTIKESCLFSLGIGKFFTQPVAATKGGTIFISNALPPLILYNTTQIPFIIHIANHINGINALAFYQCSGPCVAHGGAPTSTILTSANIAQNYYLALPLTAQALYFGFSTGTSYYNFNLDSLYAFAVNSGGLQVAGNPPYNLFPFNSTVGGIAFQAN